MTVSWPVELRGITESVVTTLGPNDRWNVAALGIHTPDDSDSGSGSDGDGDSASITAETPVTAQTWGRTRTWRNFRERGEGYVQFTRDPVDFVEAALSIREIDDPILDSAAAWAQIEVERRDAGEEGDTQWVEWELHPIESDIVRETVPTTNRGYYAVIEATVAASRLDVPTYDRDVLLERLAYFERVARRCGDTRIQTAFDRLQSLVDADWEHKK